MGKGQELPHLQDPSARSGNLDLSVGRLPGEFRRTGVIFRDENDSRPSSNPSFFVRSRKVICYLLITACNSLNDSGVGHGPKSAQGGNRGCKGQLREVTVLAQKMIGDQELRHCER